MTTWDIILGPPGTGKTTRLLEILRDELASGTPPHKIGLVTFTRRAATEAQDRVREEFGLSRADLPHFRTLHSLAMRYAGLGGSAILSGERMDEFADWIGEKITGRQAVDGVWTGYERGDRMLFMDNLARIKRMSLRDLYERDHDDLDWATVERFSRGLSDYKREHRLHDFTDMLEHLIAKGTRPQLEVLLGDEVQDFSRLQWDVFRFLSTDCRRVVVAGDDDQCIYQWAGADVDTLVALPGREVVLQQSWRVPRCVQALAGEVIARVRHRRPKTWEPRPEDGIVGHLPRFGEADLSGDSVLILARNRHMLDEIASQLRSDGVLYEKEGFPSVPKSVLSAIVVWERLRRGEAQAVEDIVDGPYALMNVGTGVQRGHKKLPGLPKDAVVTIRDLKERGGLLRDDIWHQALERMTPENRTYLVRCRRNGERPSQPPRIRLSTIHGMKGGEADRVVLLTDMAQRTWREMAVDPDSEHRVLYVAATRARKELYVVAPQTPRSYTI